MKILRYNFIFLLFLAFNTTNVVAQKRVNPALFLQDSVSFISQPSGYKMRGTLSYPNINGKYPSVILIWGSGPHTRDQEISNFPMFKIIADHLNQNGYAVLRIDKRGYGASEGPDVDSEQKTTSAELADDIYAALQFLKQQSCVDTNSIGLLGHSEGAWIAEMVALKDCSIKWMALLGAPIINGGERQANLMYSNLLRLGAKQEVAEKVRPQIERYFNFIKTGYLHDSVYYSIGKDFLLAHGMEESDISNKLIDQLLDGFKTRWYQYYFSGTPSTLISQIKIPMYFIYGGEDENVILNTDFLPLMEAVQKSGNKNVTISILSGLDHFFEEKSGEKWTLSDKLLQSISNWLNDLN